MSFPGILGAPGAGAAGGVNDQEQATVKMV